MISKKKKLNLKTNVTTINNFQCHFHSMFPKIKIKKKSRIKINIIKRPISTKKSLEHD